MNKNKRTNELNSRMLLFIHTSNEYIATDDDDDDGDVSIKYTQNVLSNS